MTPPNLFCEYVDVVEELKQDYEQKEDQINAVIRETIKRLIASKIIADRGRYRRVKRWYYTKSQGKPEVGIVWYDPHDGDEDFKDDAVYLHLFNAQMEDVVKEMGFDIQKYRINVEEES